MNENIVSLIIDKNINEFQDDTPLSEISKVIERKYRNSWRDEIYPTMKMKDLRAIVRKYDLRDEKNKLIRGRSKKIILERLRH